MRRKWESALDELATLDFDGVQMEFVAGAGGAGTDCAADDVCAGVAEAPVQVMGPLEAAGGIFDAMWFLRAGELSWPMETRAVPCCRGRCSET